MRVLLESLAPPDDEWGNFPKAQFEHSAALDPDAAVLVGSPEDADVILFCGTTRAGPRARTIRRHPWRSLYPEKTFVFSEDDVPWPTVPGIYASIRRSKYVRWRHRGGFYVVHHHSLGAAKFLEPSRVEPTSDKALFSFVGTVANHPVRERVLALGDPRAILVDTTETIGRTRYGSAEERQDGWTRFGDAVRNSAFVLCPSGRGPSSVRIFEAMMVGRAPVVIADEWVPPFGPPWETFSLRVAERDVESVPELLRAREPDAPALGRAARQAWEDFFSPQRILRTAVGASLSIQAARPIPERMLRYLDAPRVIGLRELRPLARALRAPLPGRLR